LMVSGEFQDYWPKNLPRVAGGPWFRALAHTGQVIGRPLRYAGRAPGVATVPDRHGAFNWTYNHADDSSVGQANKPGSSRPSPESR
jgi:hypothetical protein